MLAYSTQTMYATIENWLTNWVVSTNEILDNISSVIAHDTSVLKKKDQLASGIIQSLEECASRGNIDALKILGMCIIND